MSDATNPFASPATEADYRPDGLPDSALTPDQRRLLQVGELVVAWERRRLWYNAALVAVSLPLILAGLIAGAVDQDEAFALIPAAIFANACFLAGPLVDGYWTWLLGPTTRLSTVLFWLGTAAACGLAIMVCSAMVFA
ncbi:hypothetical protein KOR34_12870 [Posidoniimonas corsicana]|uniref:Uncharacterized protein n=1 Tax=Posidoniimonas corsicana TaxID=1938618 RepID=A0A5C5VFG0_9BACT|nr:hypothetical protein [Posidoniimonas corsicana]TWT36382.1 hypothetical protein KOR34_12870 [Posidoniimonas corsicana]